jgi:acetylglutamate kinase
VIRWLDLSQLQTLVETSVVQGGMLPKLEACKHALRKGVGRVRILPASEADVLPEFYFSKLLLGTEVRVA